MLDTPYNHLDLNSIHIMTMTIAVRYLFSSELLWNRFQFPKVTSAVRTFGHKYMGALQGRPYTCVGSLGPHFFIISLFGLKFQSCKLWFGVVGRRTSYVCVQNMSFTQYVITYRRDGKWGEGGCYNINQGFGGHQPPKAFNKVRH